MSKNKVLLTDPLDDNNPITVQVLGICSALAITVQLKAAIVMSLSVVAVMAASNVIVSILRNLIPNRIRIIVQLVVVASMVVLDSVIRLIPKVIGNDESLQEESFNNHLLEYPLYTQPREWKNLQVPDVLVSGDHKKIKDWKVKQSESITKQRRPDLWKKYLKSK